MAVDTEPDIRLWAAGRATLPTESAHQLALDTNPDVRSEVRQHHQKALPQHIRQASHLLDTLPESQARHHAPELQALATQPEKLAACSDQLARNASHATEVSATGDDTDAEALAQAEEAGDAAGMLKAMGYDVAEAKVFAAALAGGTTIDHVQLRVDQHLRRTTLQTSQRILPTPRPPRL